ncbi:LIN31-like protein, partial [Mya arenaria]
MFNDVSIGNQYGESPMVHSRPVSTSTPYANSNSYRRQNHENIPMSNGFVRQHQMPPTGQSTSTSRSDEELRRVVDNFVSVYEKLDRTDTADAKPNYSYTELAFLALLRAPNFALPITEIYKYIQSRFLFYKHSTRKHWKNAVRHSLAKTLCFTKIPVGRGSSQNEKLSRSTYLWCVIPSSIACFARGDYRPSRDGDNSAETLKWGYYQANAERFWLEVGDYMATKMASFKRLIQESFDPGLILEAQVCMLPNDVVAGNTNNSTCNGKGRLPLRESHLNAANHHFAVQNNSFNLQCGATTGYAGNQLQYHENHFQQQHSSTPVAAQAHCFQSGLAEKVASPPVEQDPWMPRFSIVSPDLSLSS